ncbi:rab-GTPase-TBC domain-containing protein [Collybia nuda]|uniref:Rab-GTPase-TBC domain-containing protein n=1 Tax=Collybia nuda TaxID=64659 RepID=A0A9P5XUY0_9AGAR|nr:rab-GTPase-TBC domain-containing protein [Collybia nuda]
MRAPDGSYEKGLVLPGFTASVRANQPIGHKDLEMNNPLSLHDKNPWREWFSSVELRKTILQDVERTFPDIAFFRDSEVQSQLTNILFLYSTLNPTIGYRQGMHELLAPLFYALDYDSVIQDNKNIKPDELQETCSRLWVAADAWTLFTIMMQGISKWYEWRESPQKTPALGMMSPAPPSHAHLNIGRQLDINPNDTPIVEDCNRIQSSLLRSTDPVLWKHMQAAGVEPQIYGIRWLRLLFTREFSMKDSMKIWDGIFACDPTFEIALWICVAMLIRVRNELIPADYSGQLTVLLRYPSFEGGFDGAPHHTSILLRQALALQMSPTPSTGVSLIVENHNLLNIAMDIPVPPGRTNSIQGGRGRVSGQPVAGSSTHVHPRPQPGHIGFSEMIARGLLERSESLGINKTLMSAVSELRRNIPDLTVSLGRSPSPSFPTFPLNDDKPSEEHLTLEPRTRFEMERDILHLRRTNKRLGKTLGWIVDVLLQDDTEAASREHLQKRKCEALESLSHVRDILIGDDVEIEEARLLSEEQVLDMNSKKNLTTQTSSPSAPVVARQQGAHSWIHRPRSSPHSTPYAGSLVSNTPSSGSLGGSEASLALADSLWNRARSSFSDPFSPLPAETFPQIPPPILISGPERSFPNSSKTSDQTPHRTPAYSDPLGALRQKESSEGQFNKNNT